MVSFDYAKSATTALRLIAKFGTTLTLTRLSTGAGPAHNPGAPTLTTYTVTGVVLPAQKSNVSTFDDHFEKSTMIDAKARKLIIAAKNMTVVPGPADQITLEGAQWEVEGITPLSPSGTPVIYTANLKLIGENE